MQVTEKRHLVAVSLAMAATLWVLLLVAAPWVAGQAGELGGVLYAIGALVCHQRPERSFHLGTVQLPVCARCLGGYAGVAAGLAAWAVASRWRRAPWTRVAAIRTLAASGLPTGLTVASAWLGVGDPSNAWRAALAVPLGVVGGAVLGAVSTDHLK